MTMAHEGITHPPPPIPRGTDPAHTTSRADLINLIDERIREYDQERRRRDSEQDKRKLKDKVMTYGLSGVGGLAVGVGTTLLVQRFRRGRVGSGPMK